MSVNNRLTVFVIFLCKEPNFITKYEDLDSFLVLSSYKVNVLGFCAADQCETVLDDQ